MRCQAVDCPAVPYNCAMALCSVPCPRRASRHDHEAGRGDKQQNHFGRVSPSAVSPSADPIEGCYTRAPCWQAEASGEGRKEDTSAQS